MWRKYCNWIFNLCHVNITIFINMVWGGGVRQVTATTNDKWLSRDFVENKHEKRTRMRWFFFRRIVGQTIDAKSTQKEIAQISRHFFLRRKSVSGFGVDLASIWRQLSVLPTNEKKSTQNRRRFLSSGTGLSCRFVFCASRGFSGYSELPVTPVIPQDMKIWNSYWFDIFRTCTRAHVRIGMLVQFVRYKKYRYWLFFAFCNSKTHAKAKAVKQRQWQQHTLQHPNYPPTKYNHPNHDTLIVQQMKSI